jgi:hypothetical protein
VTTEKKDSVKRKEIKMRKINKKDLIDLRTGRKG